MSYIELPVKKSFSIKSLFTAFKETFPVGYRFVGEVHNFWELVFVVDGAVGMVEMALERLNENNVVELDEERKAAMVSNLLVVLCSDESAQPVVNAGTLNH